MPGTDEGMTPGEVGRHLGRIEMTLEKGFSDIKRDLDKYVLQSVHQAELRRIDQRFREVEHDAAEAQTRQRWIAGLLVTALLGLIGLGLSVANLIT